MTGEVEPLRDAIAEYFGIDPETIKGFVLGLEQGEGGAFSSVWAASSHWQIMGWLDEMRAQQERRREALEAANIQASNGEVEL